MTEKEKDTQHASHKVDRTFFPVHFLAGDRETDVSSPDYEPIFLHQAELTGTPLQYFAHTAPAEEADSAHINARDELLKMAVSDIYYGIDQGIITNPDVVSILLQKELAAKRDRMQQEFQERPVDSAYEAAHLKTLEAEYHHALSSPATLAQFCATRAAIDMQTNYGPGNEHIGPAAAAKWFEMAGRVAAREATARKDVANRS